MKETLTSSIPKDPLIVLENLQLSEDQEQKPFEILEAMNSQVF